MYYKDLECKASAKRQHNLNQMRNAADRLKRVAAKKKARKGRA